MSITYSLWAEAPEEAALAAVQEILGPAPTDLRSSSWAVPPDGLLVRLDRVERDEWTVAEEFDVHPSSRVLFGLNGRAEAYEQQILILKVALRLVESTSTGVVLLINGEKPWLLRRQGQKLLLQHDLWDEQRLQLVAIPYELRHMAVV